MRASLSLPGCGQARAAMLLPKLKSPRAHLVGRVTCANWPCPSIPQTRMATRDLGTVSYTHHFPLTWELGGNQTKKAEVTMNHKHPGATSETRSLRKVSLLPHCVQTMSSPGLKDRGLFPWI